MERFKTLSEKLINFYAHRFFIAEERLSWAVVYISEEDDTTISSIIKIKDSDYYINIQYDMLMKKVREDHDLISFNMIDAWFSETDKNLRYGTRSGRVLTLDLDISRYTKLHSVNIPYNYDLEYTPDESVRGSLDQVYSLDFYSYKCQIDKELLRWGVIELVGKSSRDYRSIIRVLGEENIMLEMCDNCSLLNYKTDYRQYDEKYCHEAELIEEHILQFTNSLGEQTLLSLESDAIKYQADIHLQVDELLWKRS